MASHQNCAWRQKPALVTTGRKTVTPLQNNTLLLLPQLAVNSLHWYNPTASMYPSQQQLCNANQNVAATEAATTMSELCARGRGMMM
jgi:hypothetical protein